ncbi:MAG TPA: GNAT family N-acetyltransferase [Rubrobacter sp.]|nr:GNAT family N-acetyltransferase [Rubrobacter sp.]
MERRRFDAYARMCADPVVMRHMRTGVMTREQTEGQISMLVRHWKERGYGLWAEEEKASGKFVGGIGLMYREDWTDGEHRVEVGWLTKRSCWGRGLATEGALESLRWGFEDLKEERVISIIHPENLASRWVAEKCGRAVRGKSY